MSPSRPARRWANFSSPSPSPQNQKTSSGATLGALGIPNWGGTMPEEKDPLGRRDFLKTAGGAGLSLSLAGSALAARGAKNSGRVIGANDRINVGVIGCGGRGSYVSRQ